MMKPIVGANHRSTRIEIVLPVDAHGDYAYNDAGDPIPGKTPLVLTVPRFDCMTRDQFKTLNRELADIENRVDEDGEPLSAQERGIQVVVAMVRPFVSADVLTVIENMHLFELEQIAERIQEGSKMTVGELTASTSS